MNDADFLRMQQQIDAANVIAKQIIKDMTVLIEKKTCGFCNSNKADTWLATTCVYEHVETTRICGSCIMMRGISITQSCVNCQQHTIDWAVCPDNTGAWSKSWTD